MFNPERDTREDGYIEQSINWEDDEGAVELTLNQEKSDGRIQFKGGIAFLNRTSLDAFKKEPIFSKIISYERNQLESNRYHGNLLLRTEASAKPNRRVIAGRLASMVERIQRQEKP